MRAWGQQRVTVRSWQVPEGPVHRLPLPAMLCALALPLFAGRATADETPDPASQLQEVVVTARIVKENVQNVPESMTVFTPRQIAAANIQSFSGVANLTPNMSFDSTAVAGQYTFSVRGISMANGGEAPVAFVVDGVEVPDPLFIDEGLLNIQSIQVLRGPQGSLYGRNALAGAIIINTQQPGNTPTGSMTLGYGNGDARYGSAIFSGPLIQDVLFGSVAGSIDHFGGLLENTTLHVHDDSRRDQNITGRLVYKPTEPLTLALKANYVTRQDTTDTAEFLSPDLIGDYSHSYLAENIQPVLNQHLFDSSLKIDYDLGPATLTSITDYNGGYTDEPGDGDFSPLPLFADNTIRNVVSRSQELRLASNSSSATSWVVGAFYQSRNVLNALLVGTESGFGTPAGFYVIQSHDAGTSRAWALYGQATHPVLPRTDLTLGVRYDHDARTDVDADFPGSAVVDSFGALQPKASLEYHWAPDWQSYVTVARGFRSGGFNAYYSVGADREYRAQTDLDYQIGFKGTFFERRLSLDMDAYYTDVNNEQLYFVNISPPSQSVTNIDRGHVIGAEVEIAAELATGLQVRAGAGLAKTRIDTFASAPADVGNVFPLAPTYTANLSLDYVHSIGAGWRFAPYLSLTRRGPIWWDSANSISTPPKDFLDLRLSFASDHFAITPYVRNLLDDRYPSYEAGGGPGGTIGRELAEPRTYGIEAKAMF